MRLGTPHLIVSEGAHARLGDTDAFPGLVEDPLAAPPPPFTPPGPPALTLEQETLLRIAQEVQAIRAHLTRPRWYARLWAWGRAVWQAYRQTFR